MDPEPAVGVPPQRATGPRRLRVAVVVQRYGAEINGGAELLARQIAERLAQRHEVEVLTTCAFDYTTWEMHYEPGVQRVGGVTVRRFPHPARREMGHARVPRLHRIRWRLRRLLRWLPGGAAARPRGGDRFDGLGLLRCQGPHSVELLRYLADRHGDHDCAIFFTAQYEPTAVGLPLWGRRSILVPTLHEEKTMVLPQFRRLFEAAGRIFYLTAPEQAVAARLYGAQATRGEVVSVGIEPRPPAPGEVDGVRQRYGLPRRYLVYVGRIDRAKGCDELLAAFLQCTQRDAGLGLVLVGQRFMALPQQDGSVVATGFVSDDDRNAIVAGSRGWCCRRATKACRWCCWRRWRWACRCLPTPPARCWPTTCAAAAPACCTAARAGWRRCSTGWPRSTTPSGAASAPRGARTSRRITTGRA